MKNVVVVHHHEIVLKRDNRRYFEQFLMRNTRAALSGMTGAGAVRGGYGRFVIDVDSGAFVNPIVQRLRCVFGLANICAGVQVEQEIEVLCDTAEKLLEGCEFKTIRVHTNRSDKRFPLGSMAVNAKVGERLCRKFGVRANLSEPDETVYIEIVDNVAFVYRSKTKGAGGLPTGVSGRVVSLLSAGFDSPVASWRMMKRGATVIFVHFHSIPYTSNNALDQVRQLVGVLTRYQFHSKLYVIPFADIQQEIVLQAPEALRILLYRRMMLRVAEAIASQEQAEALVTGEAVGQVASQTLRNIRIIDGVATLPVLRPISGNDKEETMALAREIGTYEISSEPYDDCCSFLAPRRPQTWATEKEIADAEARLDISRLVEMALAKTTFEASQFPEIQQTQPVPLC